MHKILAASTLALLLASGVAHAETIAKVGELEISRADLEKELGKVPEGDKKAQIQRQALEQIIAERVVADAGYAAGVDKTDNVKSMMKIAERKIVADTWLKAQIEPQLTEDKVKAKYDELKAASKGEREARARHILLKTEDEAKAVIAELDKGGDFAKIAKDKSQDKAAAARGGDLGYFTKADMVKPFADAAFAMKKGDVSKTPIKTDFGWHVIKLEDIRDTKVPEYKDVKEQLKMRMGQELAQGKIRELIAKTKIERFGEFAKTAENKKN